jgi:hypothetical protein
MPFGYGTRTQQYVDVAKATLQDRIRVILESRQMIVLGLNEIGPRTNITYLTVDKSRTDDSVLEYCYRHAVEEALSDCRYHRKRYTLESAAERVEIKLSVERQHETFDHSPRVGEWMQLWSLFPHTSGSGLTLASPIMLVEFYTI